MYPAIKNGVSSHQHHFNFFGFQENPKGFRPEEAPVVFLRRDQYLLLRLIVLRHHKSFDKT